KVAAEAGLHESTRRRINRLTRRLQHLVDHWRCCYRFGVARADALGLQALAFLTQLPCFTFGARSAAGASTLELRFRHTHHLLSDSVCFLLVLVARPIDCEFRLYRARC